MKVQAINFVGWWLNAQYHLLSSWMQVLWMAWVGLMGGMMYGRSQVLTRDR